MRSWTRGARAAAGVAAAVLVTVAGACGEDEVDLPEPVDPPATGAPTTSGPDLTAEEQAAVDEALAVFDAYLEAYTRHAREGVDPATMEHYSELSQYGIAPDGYHAVVLDGYSASGLTGSGAIETELLEVVEIDLTGSGEDDRPRMTIRVCLDETGWTLVDADSGEVVEGPGERRPVTVPATFRPDPMSDSRPEEAWRLSVWTVDEGETC